MTTNPYVARLELLEKVLDCAQLTFIGRVGRDAEIRYFESGACVATCTMAMNKQGRFQKGEEPPPTWAKVEAWREVGQSMADCARKGVLIQVMGRVSEEVWTDRASGEERRQLLIRAEAVRALPSAAPAAQTAPAPARPAPDPLDDEIPF